jgi:hypothetical protein
MHLVPLALTVLIVVLLVISLSFQRWRSSNAVGIILVGQLGLLASGIYIFIRATAIQDASPGLTLATNALDAISLCLGAIGTVGTLMATAAPALLSRFGVGPRLSMDFAPSGGDDDYVHQWPVRLHDSTEIGRFARLAVRNSGTIAADNVECVIAEIIADSNKNARLGASPHLRWAHSWEKKFEDIAPGDVHQNASVHQSISPNAVAFLDLGFVMPPGATAVVQRIVPTLLERDSQTRVDDFWCFHLASRWIPSFESVLRPAEASVQYTLHLRLAARNYHGSEHWVRIELKDQEFLTKDNFIKNNVIGKEDSSVIRVTTGAGWPAVAPPRRSNRGLRRSR